MVVSHVRCRLRINSFLNHAPSSLDWGVSRSPWRILTSHLHEAVLTGSTMHCSNQIRLLITGSKNHEPWLYLTTVSSRLQATLRGRPIEAELCSSCRLGFRHTHIKYAYSQFKLAIILPLIEYKSQDQPIISRPSISVTWQILTINYNLKIRTISYSTEQSKISTKLRSWGKIENNAIVKHTHIYTTHYIHTYIHWFLSYHYS